MQRLKKGWTGLLLGAVAILMFLAPGAAAAQTSSVSSCVLNLPSGGITMTVDVNEYKSCATLPSFSSYLLASLSSVPPNLSITNGTYGGFCSDLIGYILDNPLFGNVSYSVKLWSSLDSAVPDQLKQVGTCPGSSCYTIPWDKVNYVLKNYPIP